MQFEWYINIGDDLRRAREISHTYSWKLDENYGPTDLLFIDTLYSCGDR